MASSLCRTTLRANMRPLALSLPTRGIATTSSNAFPSSSEPQPSSSSTTPTSTPTPTQAPHPDRDTPTHFKITLRRSAISLGDKIKATIESLGIHRRFQTVYFPHSPEVAGKILRIKELVEVENVPGYMVRTSWEQRQDRKATRGYEVVRGRKKGLEL